MATTTGQRHPKLHDIIYFGDVPARNVTVEYAECPPELEAAATAIAAVLKYRDLDRAIPSMQKVCTR